MFVLPSIVLGFIGSIPCLAYIFNFIFKESSGITLPPIPTAGATIQALILGLLIPLASSVIPIREALAKNLAESINSSKSKTKGQTVSIAGEDSF